MWALKIVSKGIKDAEIKTLSLWVAKFDHVLQNVESEILDHCLKFILRPSHTNMTQDFWSLANFFVPSTQENIYIFLGCKL